MKISHLFDDPTVRAMLEAAERDQGDAAPVIAREPRPLPTPGAAASARRLFLAAGPASDVFAELHAACELEAA